MTGGHESWNAIDAFTKKMLQELRRFEKRLPVEKRGCGRQQCTPIWSHRMERTNCNQPPQSNAWRWSRCGDVLWAVVLVHRRHGWRWCMLLTKASSIFLRFLSLVRIAKKHTNRRTCNDFVSIEKVSLHSSDLLLCSHTFNVRKLISILEIPSPMV